MLAITIMPSVPIFATLAWGFGPDTWGAVGFSLEGVRNNLADALRKRDGLVLTIGTQGPETDAKDRGRLLGLHKLGTLPIRTEELVEPTVWKTHLAENGGRPKWPFGLPITSAEGFDNAPLRRSLLPRLHDDNLHRKLASNFEELTKEEIAAVLALARTPVSEIWSTPLSAFAAHRLSRIPTGPKPNIGVRTLTTLSGPTATYCLSLQGTALRRVTENIAPLGSGLSIYKIGFSNDLERRRGELNSYLPDDLTLNWKSHLYQWHKDEINAWAMEQNIFKQLKAAKARHVKGEIFALTPKALEIVWSAAITTTSRPRDPIRVTVGREEESSTVIWAIL